MTSTAVMTSTAAMAAFRRVRAAVVSGALLALLAGQPAQAEIYRWTDEAGRLHVTDDPTKVPPDRLEQSKVRALRELNMVSGGAKGGSGALFAEKCGRCHLVGMESTGDGEDGDGKLAILPFLIDSDTGFPLSREQALTELRRAAEGQFSDMPRIEVSGEELEKIADYLLSHLK